MPTYDLRVASLNVSGGEKTFEEFPHNGWQARREALEILIERMDADLLCLQEASQHVDADGIMHNLIDDISKAGDYDYSFYGQTLSMETHMQVKKDVMVKGVFNDWWNWSKGNAILARIPFSRLSDTSRQGVPRNVPLYQPPAYEGNRDTDPRFVLIARIKQAPFPFVATLHLTTLVGEREAPPSSEIIEHAKKMRYKQIQRFLDLVREHILQKECPLILAGDFNATPEEPCLNQLLDSSNGFVRLKPENETSTHSSHPAPIDHIFFYPQERLVNYACRIEGSGLSRRASDHLPVVADLQIK
ncbi:MAG: endonuclease/exonuclease/phosphatase family protein [Brevefilum sp.]